MRYDDSGVGGFFEDLPVLALVLCGTAVLVMSATWSYEHLADREMDDELRIRAIGFLERVSAELRGSSEEVVVPLLSSVDRLNVSRLASEELSGHHYSLAILQLYPSLEWLVKDSDSELPGPGAAATSTRLNVLDDEGLVVIIEVRAVVW